MEIRKGLCHTPFWDTKGFEQRLLGLFKDGARHPYQDGVVRHLLVGNRFQAFCQFSVLGECSLFRCSGQASLQYFTSTKCIIGIGLSHSLSVLDPDHVGTLSREPVSLREGFGTGIGCLCCGAPHNACRRLRSPAYEPRRRSVAAPQCRCVGERELAGGQPCGVWYVAATLLHNRPPALASHVQCKTIHTCWLLRVCS